MSKQTIRLTYETATRLESLCADNALSRDRFLSKVFVTYEDTILDIPAKLPAIGYVQLGLSLTTDGIQALKKLTLRYPECERNSILEIILNQAMDRFHMEY